MLRTRVTAIERHGLQLEPGVAQRLERGFAAQARQFVRKGSAGVFFKNVADAAQRDTERVAQVVERDRTPVVFTQKAQGARRHGVRNGVGIGGLPRTHAAQGREYARGCDLAAPHHTVEQFCATASAALEIEVHATQRGLAEQAEDVVVIHTEQREFAGHGASRKPQPVRDFLREDIVRGKDRGRRSKAREFARETLQSDAAAGFPSLRHAVFEPRATTRGREHSLRGDEYETLESGGEQVLRRDAPDLDLLVHHSRAARDVLRLLRKHHGHAEILDILGEPPVPVRDGDYAVAAPILRQGARDGLVPAWCIEYPSLLMRDLGDAGEKALFPITADDHDAATTLATFFWHDAELHKKADFKHKKALHCFGENGGSGDRHRPMNPIRIPSRRAFAAMLPAAFALAGLLGQTIRAEVVDSDRDFIHPHGRTKIQRELEERGYGMFIHYGPNTFNQIEWSDGKLPVSSVNPTDLDPDSWIRTAKEAGFRHVVLVTKHHDGYCNWPTRYTDYSVLSSPVKRDVVGEVSAACKKYGVKLGLYYSLWDRHEPTHAEKDPEKYVQFMRNQLTELLVNYGPVCEIWFDGGWAKKEADWNIPSIYKLIHELQPGCAVTVNHTIGIRHGGGTGAPLNMAEGDHIRFWPVDFATKDPNIARLDHPKYFEHGGELHYLPFEHTICISDRWNWFQKNDITPARPVDELEECFYWMTGGNNALLINLPPDTTGRLRENEVKNILALADRLGIRGGDKPLPKRGPNLVLGAKTTPATAARAVDTSLETAGGLDTPAGTIEITPEKPITFDRISLVERAGMKNLGDGFSKERTYRIQKFTIEAKVDGVWKPLHAGATVGATLGIRVPLTTAEALRVNCLEASGKPEFDNIGVFDSRDSGLR